MSERPKCNKCGSGKLAPARSNIRGFVQCLRCGAILIPTHYSRQPLEEIMKSDNNHRPGKKGLPRRFRRTFAVVISRFRAGEPAEKLERDYGLDRGDLKGFSEFAVLADLEKAVRALWETQPPGPVDIEAVQAVDAELKKLDGMRGTSRPPKKKGGSNESGPGDKKPRKAEGRDRPAVAEPQSSA